MSHQVLIPQIYSPSIVRSQPFRYIIIIITYLIWDKKSFNEKEKQIFGCLSVGNTQEKKNRKATATLQVRDEARFGQILKTRILQSLVTRFFFSPLTFELQFRIDILKYFIKYKLVAKIAYKNNTIAK